VDDGIAIRGADAISDRVRDQSHGCRGELDIKSPIRLVLEFDVGAEHHP
jgi:hypothetical protein